MMTRRSLLGGAAVALMAGAAGLTWRGRAAHAAEARAGMSFPVTHTDAEWRAMLTGEQYAVLRQAATERPFTSPLLEEHGRGDFVCAGCGQALFASSTKFESGTGWPSFWTPIADDAVVELEDLTLGMIRTEVLCSDCGGHLGHVFNDGPRPTGLRYCINGLAMNFRPLPAA